SPSRWPECSIRSATTSTSTSSPDWRWPSGLWGERRCFLSRIKVLQFITGFHVGGTERQVAYLATRLDPSRFEVHVASLQREGRLYAEMASCGLPLASYPIKGFLRPETLRQQLRFATY